MAKRKAIQLYGLTGERSAFVRLRIGLNPATGFRAEVDSVMPAPVPALAGTALRGNQASTALSEGEPFADPAQVPPQASDYLKVNFRALSAAVTRPSMEGYVVDFTTPGLLQAAAGMLYGTPIHKNHWAWSVESAIGVVSQSEFDVQGVQVEGVPGINVRLNVDKRLAPITARLLLMDPPAIHAVSVKVYFKFDYSHTDLVEKGLFWRMMGDEVDGSIVRLIATEIVGFGEISFVSMGADVYNRRLEDDEDDFEDDDYAMPVDDEAEVEAGSKKKKAAGMSAAPITTPAQAKGEKTVKLSADQIAALGLSGEPTTDFAESAVLSALPALAASAKLGTELLEQSRELTRQAALRVAALTHQGEGEVKLGTVEDLLIRKADAAELKALRESFETQLAGSLTATCQSCGGKVTGLQSSVSNAPTTAPVPNAVPQVNVI